MIILGEVLTDDEVSAVMNDCMDEEDEEGQIQYGRKYKLKREKKTIYLQFCITLYYFKMAQFIFQH